MKLGIVPVLVLSAVLTLWGGVQHAGGDSDLIVTLTNQTRSNAGLAPLASSGALAQVAQSWAERMASGSVPFQHNPDTAGQIPGGWLGWGENIAWRTGGGAGDLYAQWLASAPHYANIVGDFDQIGVGDAVAADGAVYGVEVFGKYSAPAPAPAPAAPAAPAPAAPAPAPAAPAADSDGSAPPQAVDAAPAAADDTPASPTPTSSPRATETAPAQTEGPTPVGRASGAEADHATGPTMVGWIAGIGGSLVICAAVAALWIMRRRRAADAA